MKKFYQNGFTHLVIVVVVAVIAVVAAAGYLVLKNGEDSSNSSSSSSSSAADNKLKDENSVKTAAKDHFALVYKKMFEEAYQSTCQGFKDNTSYSVFKTSLEQAFFSTLDLSTIEYTSVDIRNDQAQISGPIGPVAPDSDLNVNLLKNDGQWCVFGYKIE